MTMMYKNELFILIYCVPMIPTGELFQIFFFYDEWWTPENFEWKNYFPRWITMRTFKIMFQHFSSLEMLHSFISKSSWSLLVLFQPISRSTVPRSMTRWTNSGRAFSQNRAANDLIMLHSVHYIHWWCICMPTLIVSWPVAWEVSVAVVTHRPHATGFQRLCCR